MKRIVLYGAGGHVKAAIELIRSTYNYTVEAIYDDQPKTDQIFGIPVFHSNELKIEDRILAITVGNNLHRQHIVQKYPTASFPTFIHNTAVTYPSVSIGMGSQVLPLAVLDAAVKIGNFCIVNNHATVSHDVVVDDFCHIAINATIAGGVSVGEGTLVGAGSVILPEIKIGKWAIIGAGAVVTRDVPDYAVVYGNPATIIKKTNETS